MMALTSESELLEWNWGCRTQGDPQLSCTATGFTILGVRPWSNRRVNDDARNCPAGGVTLPAAIQEHRFAEGC